MARLAGVDLPREKRIEIGLTYIWNRFSSFSRNIKKSWNKSRH